MADERTYGFSRDDAQSLVQSISHGEVIFPEIRPRPKRGGGGGGIIQFAPIDVCEGIGFTCDCVTARVVTATCGSGLSPDDEVQVWDQSRGWFQMPEDLLFRSIGWAHKVKVTEADIYEGLPFYIGECRWVVISMDCIEQDQLE
jgi:hypothetical protein